ncbi:RNA polymerase sigma factor (sigma-70 family) [Allocatelliglobosispora scoriae]|uniref:RNA polymerase sigma factor (Sigma-70 family) n=1 Tax=Allocatelliglobosispora scoriae TaxID=643052 RepID=A0A841BZF1_9ACTN|nr:RNA polymerase sigma factor [Allocatelliglobosispora scoriae]MBB5872966.1 RNA polymerase sigma factor (sigma-70 family) [Allocatelliglobosispora scoriae]
MTHPDAHRTIETVWRLESARIIAALTRLVRDVGLAEDLAHDALIAALSEWPETGVPANPGGWLMLTAKHRAIDRLRRDDRFKDKIKDIGHEYADQQRVAVFTTDAEFEAVLEDDPLSDDLLRLIFIACHPVLPTPARVALTLRLLGGLTTEEIARAFLVPEPTVAQRIVRAKKTLAEKKIPFEVPPPAERADRLASVLEVVYLVFNEGYSATSGDDWMRPELCREALRLGRMLAELAPDEPEVHGLAALMELQASRLRARVDADGHPIPLPEQNRGRWDQLLIRRGFAALLRARQLGRPAGPYVLQAAIAACHAQPGPTDWVAIATLYESLAFIAPSPIVQLNRAVAIGQSSGPEAALRLVDELADRPELRGYHLLPTVRGDLLARLGRDAEARAEFAKAAEMTANARERDVLLRRAG